MSDKTHHAHYDDLPEAFAKLGVRNSLLRGLAEAGFETPSEIQSLLIPRALAGVDLLGQARTGTGKTAAFGIPVLQKAVAGFATQALILVPTRELAVQVEAELERLGKFTPIKVVAVYGGQRIGAQMKRLKHNPEILVGTPGRVMDLIERRIIDFANIRFVVLDEVDRMLDIGFREDIKQILESVDRGFGKRTRTTEFGGDKIHPDAADAPEGQGVPDLPEDEDLQTIFVSATISGEIERMARKFMREGEIEKLIAPGADEKPTVEKVDQCYIPVGPQDKFEALMAVIEAEGPELAIVFTRTKRGAEKVAKKLHSAGVECREIHGNLNQSKREKVMKHFRENKFRVLVATDLASRGIDVAGVSHIINFDVPEDPEAYVHRVGRTARMGAVGKAYTFVTPDQGGELTKIESLINMLIPRGEISGYEPTVRSEKPTAQVAEPSGDGEAAEPEAGEGAVATAEAPTNRRRRRTMAKVPRSRRR